jgi:hypothetical protein
VPKSWRRFILYTAQYPGYFKRSHIARPQVRFLEFTATPGTRIGWIGMGTDTSSRISNIAGHRTLSRSDQLQPKNRSTL